MKIGFSLILVIAAELLLASAGASARGIGAQGFGGGAFAGHRFAVQRRSRLAPPPGRILAQPQVFAVPTVRRRHVIEHRLPVHRRVVVRPIIVPPVVASPQIIVVSPFTDCPQ